MNLEGNGNQASFSAAHIGAVPIGRAVSGSMPPFTQDGRLAGMNTMRDHSSSPNHKYGNIQGAPGSVASHEFIRRTPSQASASPQHHFIENYASGLSVGQPTGMSKAWTGAADRFKQGPPTGSSTSEMPPLNVNASANVAKESFSASSFGAGSHGHGHPFGNSVIGNGNPAGPIVNGSQNPSDMTYGGGYSSNNASQAGASFVPQRASGSAIMPNLGFQPTGPLPGGLGMGIPRAHGQGHFVPVADDRMMSSVHMSQRFNGFPDIRGMQPVQRQPQTINNTNPMLYPASRTDPPFMAGNAQPQQSANGPAANNSADLLGRGVPLTSIELGTKLYIVEFTAKRTDVFYADDPSQEFHEGEVVIVEADRGKDLGTVINDTVTLEEVKAFAAARRQSTAHVPGRTPQVAQPAMPQGGLLQSQLRGVDVGHADPAETAAVQGLNKEIMPKRIFRVATPGDLQ